MQDNQRASLGFVQKQLPWLVAAAAMLLYVATLNRWVTLDSLPYVAKVTGWDWTMPFQYPLFYLLTYPLRFFPAGWQPVLLNLFSAVCAGLTLALLARSVALLPHDRTHDQRLRERSEFSLLSIRGAWLPPVLAALVCGLELTFWEHATSATNELLNLLLFAYAIRCLLEYRIDHRESWLTRMALVYGLAVTNNWAMIGFFPCFLAALIWIKGSRFFDFRFVARMLAFGLLGLSLYLLLPVIWAFSDNLNVGFWEALRAQLASQKAMLFDTPALRVRVLVLSLTSILPIVIIGIRWPASFGDTSAAGAALSSAMFKIIHTVFLVACIWVAFNQQFSPRALAFGLPFLTFYYLGALSIGYFSGYLLLVSRESRSKSWHKPSGLQLALNKVVVAAVWMALVFVPAGLIYNNWQGLRTTNGPLLSQFADLSAKALPPHGALVLSDDPFGLLLLSARLERENSLSRYMLVHTRSLSSPDYHRQLGKRYPSWPNTLATRPADESISDVHLLALISSLSRTNEVFYLHPSFGYYFELFYMQPHGLIYKLDQYSPDTIYPPALEISLLEENQQFWSRLEDTLKALISLREVDSRDIYYQSRYYARALNYWGVTLQRHRGIEEAGKAFQLALDLDPGSVPAQSNQAFNRALRTGQPWTPETGRSIEERFRAWEPMLVEKGPFDHPDFCLRLGQIFAQQALFRQSAIQLDRVLALNPTNLMARVALADIFLQAQRPDQSLEEISRIRAEQGASMSLALEMETIRLEASALFALRKTDEAVNLLVEAASRHPKNPGVLDTLVEIYAQTERFQDALATAEKIIQADPNRPTSHINKAILHFSNNDYPKAIASVDRVLEKSPHHPQALPYKIFILLQSKEFDKARTEIERLLNAEPDNPEALLYKAVVEIETKAYDRAVEPLDLLIERQPSNFNALRNRAIAHLNRGDLAKAQKDYERLRKLMPGYYVAYYGLGEVAYRRKDMGTALKFYELYLQHLPQDESAELQEEKRMVAERISELKQARR
jgi:tetratricopeptide (TPR) repeat protein